MLERISYLVILVLLLAGCRQGVNDSAGLVELDSLIAAAPDSAAARLADWPADSLRTAGDRAYHALLLTQARYKAYIPATSDSAINLAVAYYSDGDDYDRWIRSLIYKACVMSELNQPDSAMFWFKRAETIARPGDHANLGYINFRIADIYQYEYVAPKQAVDSYNQALAHYRKSNQSFYEMACLSELASLSLLTSGTIDYQCFTAALCKSMMLNDMDYICANLTTLAASYFFQKEYHKSMGLLSAVLAIPASETVKSKCHLMLAQNYATESMADSALWHLEQASIQTSVDSMLYCRSMALVNSGKGNISEFKIHDETADRIAHNLLMSSAATELKETEAEYDLRLSEVGNQSIKLKILLAGLVLFIVVMLAVALVIIRRLKVNQQHEEINRQRVQNQALESAICGKEAEITAHESHIRHLSDAIVERNQAISSLVNDQSLLIDRRDELLRQSAQLSQELQSLRIELASFKENEREDKKSIELLREQINAQRIHVLSIVSEMTQGADIFFRTLMEQSMSKEMSSQKFRQYVNANFMTKLRSLLDVAYPALSQRMSGADCNSDDQEIVYLHFAGFTNEMICCYLNLTNKKTISNKKKSIAAKILGDDASISQLAE